MMKRLFLIGLLLTVMLISVSAPAFVSAYEPIKAEIPVEIKRGGTAQITPNVNCPIPEVSLITVKNKEVGKFEIYFDDVGMYSYTVKTVPDDRDLIFDSKIYTVEIYVNEQNGELVTTVVAYLSDYKYSIISALDGTIDYGPERLLFVNRKSTDPDPQPSTEPTEPTEPTTGTNPPQPTTGSNPPQPTTKKGGGKNKGKKDESDSDSADGGIWNKRRNPRTGDDTKIEEFFLLAMNASAGLLTLSIIYLVDTELMIKRKKEGKDK
jgi:hypothetical protein